MGTYLPEEQDKTKRKALKGDDLKQLKIECRKVNDDIRWMLALISDTGMRLAECAGLLRSDLVLDAEVPHVIVQSHSHRSLKTQSSNRKIPLVGDSLWAAKRVLENTDGTYCFSRYNTTETTNSNSASAAANKWMKERIGGDAVVHGMRHGLRDRLRAVEAPLEIIDQIGGWSAQTVGQTYGEGYSLKHMQKWLELAAPESV